MDFGRIQIGRRANRRFNYRPMYYDADKEDLDERVKRAKMSADGTYEVKGFEDRIRKGFKSRETLYTNNYNVISGGRKIRILFIIIVLGLTYYLMFNTKLISFIFEAII